jgi:salicylate hydroxylase
MPEVERRPGAPQYAAHRADILKGITNSIHTLPNVTLRTNARVMGVDMDAPSVTMHDGTTLAADVLIGADGMSLILTRTLPIYSPASEGVKSACRKKLYQSLGLTDKARPTGDAAFRAMIPLQRIQDPELVDFVKTPITTRWIGPGRHVQGFPIRDHNLYNLVSITTLSAPNL